MKYAELCDRLIEQQPDILFSGYATKGIQDFRENCLKLANGSFWQEENAEHNWFLFVLISKDLAHERINLMRRIRNKQIFLVEYSPFEEPLNGF